MLSIYQLKPRFQAMLRPMVRKLYLLGITANQITVTAAMVSLLLGAVLAANAENPLLFLLMPVWMLIRMALNAMDGMLAREFGQKSQLGAILNELCDLISDCALYLPFALLHGIYSPLVLALVLSAWLSEYAGVMGALIGASRRYDGPMGKSDRAFIVGLIAVPIAFNMISSAWLNLIFASVTLLALYTTYKRVNLALMELTD